MAIIDQTYKQQILNVKINYKTIKERIDNQYSIEIKKYIDAIETRIFRWLRVDLEYPNDSVIQQSAILSNINSYNLIGTYITYKQQIVHYSNPDDKASDTKVQIENIKTQIQTNVVIRLDGWWQYDLYLQNLFGTDGKLLSELEIKLDSLDDKIIEVTELSYKLTNEHETVIASRKEEFDSLVIMSRTEFTNLIGDYKVEKQNELAENYSKIFEERAEGRSGMFMSPKCSFLPKLYLTFNYKFDGYKPIANQWKLFLMILIIVGLLSVFLIDPILYDKVYPLLPEKIRDSQDFIKNIPLYFGSIKISFFSILGYSLFITNKNYSNNRHLYNVYRQKADTLKMFRAFRDTVNDEKLQSEISMLIAKTIFEPVETGYIKQTSEGNSIIENFITKSHL
jgi:hypothetical protein